MGIGTRAEAKTIGMSRQANVHRQYPQLAQQLQDARLGGGGKGDDQHVDAGETGELKQFRESAELRIAGDHDRSSAAATVVENARSEERRVGKEGGRA